MNQGTAATDASLMPSPLLQADQKEARPASTRQANASGLGVVNPSPSWATGAHPLPAAAPGRFMVSAVFGFYGLYDLEVFPQTLLSVYQGANNSLTNPRGCWEQKGPSRWLRSPGWVPPKRCARSTSICLPGCLCSCLGAKARKILLQHLNRKQHSLCFINFRHLSGLLPSWVKRVLWDAVGRKATE